MTVSLARQLIRKVLWLSLMGLVGLGGVVTLSLMLTFQQVQQRLEQASLTAANDFDDVFLKLESDLLATSTSLASNGDISKLLSQMRSRNRYLMQAQLLNHSGDLFVSSSRSKRQPINIPFVVQSRLKRNIDQIYISPANLDDNALSVELATGFTDELGLSQGILAIQVDLTELENQAIQQQVGKTGYVYILDEAQQVVATNQLHRLGKTLPEQKFSLSFLNLSIRQGLNQKLVLSIDQSLQRVPWSAVVEQPVTEAIQPAVLPIALTIIVLFVSFRVIVDILCFSQRDIVTPLQNLHQGVEEFKAGHIPQLTPANPGNELGQLTNAFQNMVIQLKKAFEELESRVKERTSQLEITNQALQQEVAKHQATTQSLLKSEIQFRQTFQLAPIGMALISVDETFLMVNQSLCELLDLPEKKLLLKTWSDFIEPGDLEIVRALIQDLSDSQQTSKQCEVRCQSQTRGPLFVVLNLVLINDFGTEKKPSHLIAQIVDVTDRKKAEEQLAYEALHDHLTGLANRCFLIEVIDRALRRLRRYPDYVFAVLFLDLDRFKMVNDSLGHNIGDELLIQFAQRLRHHLREEDTIARLGGDEFAVLLDNIGDRQEVITIVERILSALVPLFEVGTHQVSVGASIGIAFCSPHYASAKDVLRDADIAMYQMKKSRAGEYAIFHEGMYDQTLQRLELESQIRQALEQQEFFLNYQPIVDLKTQTISGFEALVRWQKSDGTVISPGQFIPVAEESGLIVELGSWVMEQACRDLQYWRSQNSEFQSIEVSVNLARDQLQHPDFLQRIDQILSTFQVADSLKLELTESMLMESHSVTFLHQLKRRGIKLSIDDFGTGYSSLRYLQNFPVDTLKIDRSFVMKMKKTKSDMEVVRAIISLAHTFGLDVVAEGVETTDQMHHLSILGCQFGQGFLFSKPLNAKQVKNQFINSLIS
ncbi:diguanylate cyclase/phosphodiesterase with PAS/PAC sensor(s) [[Leptolyngbya] sp. PCC 7376]|uniref:EAL domain-containing protein n=1 Tax=[Leptolyngbya] sp. PCC 7376 TaxID=111781 RepID=UPI00029F122A|nr:EAL domain-containing protein [[Leptolyngbya] sp. PCC 7376]AFY37908.1 diguanylate cyclase/phosphodiesterase with PAS/PAC sensor(s) [[Leptolyngbya] sp. PCC 7376]